MLLAVLFLANYFKRFPNNIRWLIAVVIVCAISYVFVLLFKLYLVHTYLPTSATQTKFQGMILLQFNFANPRFFDHFATWFLPILCLALLRKDDTKLFKALSFIAMSSLWFVVIAHSSRALILEYIVIFIVLGILNYKLMLKFISWQILAAIVGAILFYIVHQIVGGSSILDRAFFANQDRWDLWAKSLALAAHYPLLGVGELNALYYLRDYPHNIVLTVAAQWGIIGLTCFLLVGLRSFRRACEYMRSYKHSALYFVAFASVLAGMTHAMLSNLFKLQLSQFSMIFAMGLLLSFMPQVLEQNSQKKCHMFFVAPLIITILAILIIVPFFTNVTF
ncbi:O-antigen ligase family protein [Fastidiosibacter lacustris]|uniref:O-antigen ligase family protein n=1 Tax=Fastidiosibacter lacustris TaxID=2056695 RepID=UPI001300AD02|nr:O-antigen ligase family protein [Fastidiosibacter lacustris]